MKEAIREFLKFEKKLLSNPKTFFTTFEQGFDARQDIIYKEYLEWQNGGGKIKDLEIKEKEWEFGGTFISWKFGNEWFAMVLSQNSFFTVYQFKKVLSAIYSFLEDRPQYYKFRKMDGEYMFNPLKLLKYKLLKV